MANGAPLANLLLFLARANVQVTKWQNVGHFSNQVWSNWQPMATTPVCPESFWTSTVHEAAEWLDAWTALSGIPPHMAIAENASIGSDFFQVVKCLKNSQVLERQFLRSWEHWKRGKPCRTLHPWKHQNNKVETYRRLTLGERWSCGKSRKSSPAFHIHSWRSHASWASALGPQCCYKRSQLRLRKWQEYAGIILIILIIWQCPHHASLCLSYSKKKHPTRALNCFPQICPLTLRSHLFLLPCGFLVLLMPCDSGGHSRGWSERGTARKTIAKRGAGIHKDPPTRTPLQCPFGSEIWMRCIFLKL